MNFCSVRGVCFLLGLSLSAFETAERVVAGEPLPDASVVAYRGSRKPKPPAPPKISEVTLTGVITAVQPTGLTIKAGKTANGKDQKQWLVLAQSDATEFTIHGTATVDYLRKGQTVEFSGQIVTGEKTADKAKEDNLADKVKELTIFSRKGGSSPIKKGSAKGHPVDPGIGRIEVAKEADVDASLTTPGDSPSKAGNGGKPVANHEAAPGGAKEKIIGRIEKCTDKSLTVTRGQQTIHVDLVEIPTINVELSDPKVVPNAKDHSKSRIEGKGTSGHTVTMMASDLVGAKIVVHGTAAESKQGSECAAKSIEVTLMAPLTGIKSAASDAKKTKRTASAEK